MDYRIPLSKPDVGADERALLLDAFDFGSLDTWGAHVEGFEADMATYLGGQVQPVALTSGSAALHLALMLAGVGSGDWVLCPTLAHVATVNEILKVGARPVLVDSSPDTWNVDPELLIDELRLGAREGRRPAAVVTVDLYGQCADHGIIVEVAQELEVPVIEDAAQALGATYGGEPAGTLTDYGILSFGADQIITTSEGGMLLTREQGQASRARELASAGIPADDSREQPEAGLDYRLSDLLAAVGRAQLRSLDTKVARRRANNRRYRDHLADLAGVTFQAEPRAGRGTHWLTCLTIVPNEARSRRDEVLSRLAEAQIEAQPILKPLHLQSAHGRSRRIGGELAEQLFETGLCLPSGTTLTSAEIDEVAGIVAATLA